MRLVPGVLVAMMVIPGASQAQTGTAAPENSRFFAELNFGAASSLAKSREFPSYFPIFGEVATTPSTYPKPSANPFAAVDLGGGVMLMRSLGVGLPVPRTTNDAVLGS